MMRNLNLYIARHGQTMWNQEKRMQGHQDSALTDLGKGQAKKLRDSLKETKWEAIYASPLQRALATANIIRGKQAVPIICQDDLREMCFGDWEGKLHQEIAKQEPQKYEDFWMSPDLYVTSSGESFFEVEKRVLKALRKIMEQHQTGNVLIVTHTVVVKLLMAYFEQRPLGALWNPPTIEPTALCQVEIKKDQTTILLHGDTSHC